MGGTMQFYRGHVFATLHDKVQISHKKRKKSPEGKFPVGHVTVLTCEANGRFFSFFFIFHPGVGDHMVAKSE